MIRGRAVRVAVVAVVGLFIGVAGGVAAQSSEPHFRLASDLRSLAALGDLARTRILAEELLDPQDMEALPDAATNSVAELRNAVERILDAATVDDATFAVAELGVACGTCHRAAGVDPSAAPADPAPEMENDASHHRDYLAWASRLLWDGLVGPSQQSWRLGAGALVGEESYPRPAARHVPSEVNRQAATELDRLAVQAVTAEDSRSRADLLARVWTTCAGCHVPAGVVR